jgi:Lar family restriction alleviation protein
MKKVDLKTCPHCGGQKLRIDDNGISVFDLGVVNKPESYWGVCLTCFAAGSPGKDRKEAAENWNRRAP